MCCHSLKEFERKRETFYANSPYIAEFYNTLSNLPFIIFGLSRLLFSNVEDPYLWYFLISFGVCSGIHHCFVFRGSIIVDYIPIVLANMYIYVYYLYYLDINDFVHLILPLFILITDHLGPIMPVPWGHVCWHLLASCTIYNIFVKFDGCYKKMI